MLLLLLLRMCLTMCGCACGLTSLPLPEACRELLVSQLAGALYQVTPVPQ